MVKNKVWFEVTEQVMNDEASVGWRQGYSRVKSTVFEADLTKGTLTEIYSY